MKNLTLARAYLWTGIFATIGLISCSERDNLPPPDSTPHKWEANFQYALSKSADNQRQLSLKRYSYRGKVKTVEEKRRLMDEMFGDGAYTIIYYDYDYANPTIETWGNVKDIRKNYYEEVRAGTEADIVIGETDIIDLEWTCRDETYRTTAIADPSGEPIYDNIGSNATAQHISYQSSRMIILGDTKEESLNTYSAKYEIDDYMSDTTRSARIEMSNYGYSYLENSGILANWIMRTPPLPRKPPQGIQPQPIDRTNVDLP